MLCPSLQVMPRDAAVRPGFATQRIAHCQKINPKLIIKELDIVIEKIVGTSLLSSLKMVPA